MSTKKIEITKCMFVLQLVVMGKEDPHQVEQKGESENSKRRLNIS